jgi:hypothetical protein
MRTYVATRDSAVELVKASIEAEIASLKAQEAEDIQSLKKEIERLRAENKSLGDLIMNLDRRLRSNV